MNPLSCSIIAFSEGPDPVALSRLDETLRAFARQDIQTFYVGVSAAAEPAVLHALRTLQADYPAMHIHLLSPVSDLIRAFRTAAGFSRFCICCLPPDAQEAVIQGQACGLVVVNVAAPPDFMTALLLQS